MGPGRQLSGTVPAWQVQGPKIALWQVLQVTLTREESKTTQSTAYREKKNALLILIICSSFILCHCEQVTRKYSTELLLLYEVNSNVSVNFRSHFQQITLFGVCFWLKIPYFLGGIDLPTLNSWLTVP